MMDKLSSAVSDQEKRLRWQLFQQSHPEVAAWIEESTFSFVFARTLKAAVYKTGQLTPKQLASAEKCVINSAQHLLKKPDAIVPIQAFRLQLGQLARRGSNKPEINVGPFLFSTPDKRSPNRDFIYIFIGQGKTFLGKVNAIGELFVHPKFPREELQGSLAALCALVPKDTDRANKPATTETRQSKMRKTKHTAYRRETVRVLSQADQGFAESSGKAETPAHARFVAEPLGSRTDFLKSNKTLSEEIKRRN